MTRYPIRPVDVTRTGSPTNIVNESVFFASNESETNDDDPEKILAPLCYRMLTRVPRCTIPLVSRSLTTLTLPTTI